MCGEFDLIPIDLGFSSSLLCLRFGLRLWDGGLNDRLNAIIIHRISGVLILFLFLFLCRRITWKVSLDRILWKRVVLTWAPAPCTSGVVYGKIQNNKITMVRPMVKIETRDGGE